MFKLWILEASESSKTDLYNCHNCGANNAPAKQEEVEKHKMERS
jgi:hypothetical protein